MATAETLEEFYQHKFNHLPGNLGRQTGHFNVFRVEDCVGEGATPVRYSRRDFYKISLIRGDNIYHYADKSLRVAGSALLFFNPQVPYTWQPVAAGSTGFFCIFKAGFFTGQVRTNLAHLPMFAPGGKPAYFLDPPQDQQASRIFEKMLGEIDSDYPYKHDLLRNYVTELMHTALKLQPSETLYQHPDANSRITAIFTELLERQFPIESPARRLAMRSARDFAEQLAVHVNHLNRAVKQTTGKTTTEHIAQRLTGEAIALLKHTDWNISEIGYCLGFEEPAHFNNFFKKQTTVPPSAYRAV